MDQGAAKQLPDAVPKSGRKVMKRQASVPTKLLSGTLRRGSQPENEARSTKLANGLNKGTMNASPPVIGSRAGMPVSGRSNANQSPRSIVSPKTTPPANSTKDLKTKTPLSSPKKPPEFGKGRLERGKQISHLGLFPDSETKRMQRQSTSMNAEAGDQPANLDDVLSPNPQDKKLSVQWRQQVEHISQALMDYAESHPQFSSQLTFCRLENIVGLKTTKPSKGDELIISMTFGITPVMFDFRASSGGAAANKPAPIKKRVQSPGDGILNGGSEQPDQSVGSSVTTNCNLQTPAPQETPTNAENQ